MEFLGDSVMQLVVSEYVYKHFPEHHEGHLSVSWHLSLRGETLNVLDYADVNVTFGHGEMMIHKLAYLNQHYALYSSLYV